MNITDEQWDQLGLELSIDAAMTQMLSNPELAIEIRRVIKERLAECQENSQEHDDWLELLNMHDTCIAAHKNLPEEIVEETGFTTADFEALCEANKVLAQQTDPDEEINAASWLLDHLPESDRATARARIEAAAKAGWRHIGLWTDDEAATIEHLAGIDPATGQCSFLP